MIFIPLNPFHREMRWMETIDNKFLKGQLVEAFMVILLAEIICYGGLRELVVK